MNTPTPPFPPPTLPGAKLITAKGYNGTVTLDGDFVTITRKGFLARASVGKGEKRIPLRSITAVQWKQPGVVMNGFIQFTLGGGNERRSTFGRQTRDAVDDENSVIVTMSQRERFLAVRSAVESAIAAAHAPTSAVGSAPVSMADELKKLSELHAAGVLTDVEFAQQKAKLLG